MDHPTRHPVLACVDAIDEALKSTADVEPGFMTVADKREALVALSVLSGRLESLRLRVIAASADVADAEGHRDVASWLTHRTRADRTADRRAQHLADALDRRWNGVGTGLAVGSVNLDQGQVIIRALDALPTEVGPEVLAQAQAHLIKSAATFGPRELRVLGRRVLGVVAPELADIHEGKALAAEEAAALARTHLTVRPLGDGTALIRGLIPEAVATRLSTYLEAFTSPRRAAVPTATDRRPHDVRLGHAFCSLLEMLDPKRIPLHGGDATTLVITMDIARLTEATGAASLADGSRISAGEARRLACTALLVPAVLGTASEPLDLGRAARLFTPAQRKALAVRDRMCRADGCTIPATWCEAHHLVPWSRLGATDLANGVLLCSHHHHRIHDDRYLHDRLPNGDLRFSRRR